MYKLDNDSLINIITNITNEKNKEIIELENKVKKLNYDLEKEKLKIINIKYKTDFDLDYFCCDFCCDIYNMDDISKLYDFIEPYLCKYCEKKSIYTKDILNASIMYIIDNISYNKNICYYIYNDIPKRYIKNSIFTIEKYYYDDFNKLLEDSNNNRYYENAKKDIIQKGVDLSYDYRNDINLNIMLRKMKEIINKKI